jgi:predicted outer membrane repeat protein
LIALNVTLTGNQGKDAAGNVGYGGGIFNDGNLTLTFCALRSNQAGNGGGLFNNGTAVIKDVTFDTDSAGSGTGGGIYNSGFLTLEKATINGSVAGSGGGLFNDGIMDLTNVTLSGNSATNSGGGIYNGSLATAGVVAETTLTNVTLSDNTAANESGGGIYNKTGNTFTVKNTIIANSTGGNCAGDALNSSGHNLDEDYSCGLANPTDLPPQDPNLGPLTDNGGPTFTQKLGNNNAKDVGTGCPDRDQRGYPRDLDACDIGAYEDTDKNPYPAITTLVPNSKPEGESGFTLTVNGYTYGTFVLGLSVVHWNGSPRPTAFVNTSQITAEITTDDLASAGTAKVTVLNPGQGGGLSNEVVFTITRTNPFPKITALSPKARPAAGPAFTLTVDGSDYVDQSSVVRWNGIARPTTFVSPSQLTADIPATDLAAMGTAWVTVSNSPPGGGISDPPTPFTIGPPIVYLPLILRN